MEDIIEFLKDNPGVHNLNKHIEANMGWQPAIEKDRKAGFTN